MEKLRKDGVTLPAPLLLRGFSIITQRRLRGGFRAVRALHAERLRGVDGPVVVCLNHPSWWDPLLCFFLARTLLPGRRHFAPISAKALQRYRIFGRLGMFGVEQDSPRGAAQFLRAGAAVLEIGGVLWVPAQGRFADARERPVTLKSGLGALLARRGAVTVLPLALEYTFWNQRLPEALVNIGAPLTPLPPMERRDAKAWTSALSLGLEAAQDELSAAAMARSAQPFETLLEGSGGSSGVYGAWQRIAAKFGGRSFTEDHEAEVDSIVERTPARRSR